MTESITVLGIFAAAPVKDYGAALTWYEKFMGRPADDQPIPGMAQWRNMDGAGLQIWKDEERAGKAIMTIVVTDLSKEIDRLSAAGLSLVNETSGNFGSIVQVFDPEGNRINLTQPPQGFVNR